MSKAAGYQVHSGGWLALGRGAWFPTRSTLLHVRPRTRANSHAPTTRYHYRLQPRDSLTLQRGVASRRVEEGVRVGERRCFFLPLLAPQEEATPITSLLSPCTRSQLLPWRAPDTSNPTRVSPANRHVHRAHHARAALREHQWDDWSGKIAQVLIVGGILSGWSAAQRVTVVVRLVLPDYLVMWSSSNICLCLSFQGKGT